MGDNDSSRMESCFYTRSHYEDKEWASWLPVYLSILHMHSVWPHLHSTAKCESVHFHEHHVIAFLFVHRRGIIIIIMRNITEQSSEDRPLVICLHKAASGSTFVLGTGIRMEVCVRNLVVRGFHWTTGSDCGPKPFLRHMRVHLTVWRSKGPYNRPYFIWLLSNQIGCEQPDLVHEGIPAYSHKTCFCERKIAPSLIETPPL